jgi:hypothetical protein
MQCASASHFFSFSFLVLCLRAISILFSAMNGVSPIERSRSEASVKSPIVEIASMSSQSHEEVRRKSHVRRYRLHTRLIFHRDAKLEATCPSDTRATRDNPDMLGIHCCSSGVPHSEPTRWRHSLRAIDRRTSLSPTISLLVPAYRDRCAIQHLLGLDRSRNEENGTLLSTE